MCDTVFGERSQSGELFDRFLNRTLRGNITRPHARLTQETLNRLAGHLPGALSCDTVDLLHEVLDSRPPRGPAEDLVAPALRSVEDFREARGIVTKVSLPGEPTQWRRFGSFLADEALGKVVIEANELESLVIDPRSPSLWTTDDYDLIAERPHKGSGRVDRIADVAAASIRLSAFSTHPHVPEGYISGTLRHFVLTAR